MRKRKIFLPGLVAVCILLMCILTVHACRKQRDWSCGNEALTEMRVVEQSTGIPVEGAIAYLVSKPNGSVPIAAYNRSTDQYGRVEWDCSWAITHVCVEAGDAYWDQCGSGYSIQDDFLQDAYYELKPKSWVRMNLIDTLPSNPELRVVAFSDYDDSFEAEGLVPGGYTDVLGIVGGTHTSIRIRMFDVSGEYISSDIIEVNVSPGDTTEYTYRF
jgi:hypothetical protein